LFLCYYGDFEGALEALRLGIERCRSTLNISGNPAWASHAMQVLINIARIYLFHGDLKGLFLLNQLEAFAVGTTPLEVEGILLPPAALACSGMGDDNIHKDRRQLVREAICETRLVDLVGMLVQQEQWPELSALVEEYEEGPAFRPNGVGLLLVEARVRALIGLGMPEKAASVLRSYMNEADGMHGGTFRVLLAEVLCRVGEQKEAVAHLKHVLQHLEPLTQNHEVRTVAAVRFWKYLVGLGLWRAGAADDAYSVAEEAHELAASLNDQVGQLKSCILLSQISRCTGAIPALERWRNHLIDLSGQTYYQLERAVACWELGQVSGGESYLQECLAIFNCLPAPMTARLRKFVPSIPVDFGKVPIRSFRHPELDALYTDLRFDGISGAG
jgi:hypothetical protein